MSTPAPVRILLIDDEEQVAVRISELLREINGRVVQLDWTSDAESGFVQLLKGAHDVYLLDYHPGDIDGIDLLSRARATGCRSPIIILTGQSEALVDQQALQAGATDYLVKDLTDVSRLEHAIRYALEHQRLLTELQHERALLRALMENLPDNIYFKDRDSHFIRVNRSMAHWFGLDDPAQAIGKSDHDFFTAEHAEQARRDELKLIETGQPLLAKEECETWPDGRTTWVSTSKLPLRDERGQVVGTFGISRDITEEKAALTALRSSERLNRLIVDTALDAFVAMNAEGAIVDWNPQAERIFGWQREEVLGQPLADVIIPAQFRHLHWQGLEQYHRTRTGRVIGQRLEVTALQRSGREFPAELTVAAIHREDGVLFAAFVHDITLRKQAESELRKSKEAAEAANRAKSDFLANMSHEIRTPMNAILGMTELVLDTELTASQREYLAMVRDSGEALLRLLNDILDFSKIEAGKLELESAAFSLRELIGDTLKALALRAHREQLELACHVNPQLPDALVGDPARLRQVIVNLVGNAIKFTPQGEVLVDVTIDTQHDDSATLHFAVRDTGIGIPPDKLQAIFNAFEQADSSTTRKYGGTGLGLAICSRLVECMRGRIWVESELGRGSTFHFTAQFGLAESAPKKPNGRIVRGTRVLVVDDNATNRLILDEMLKNWGLVPTCAASAGQALEELRHAQTRGEPFGLVLSDVHMPGEDGFSLAAQVQADTALAEAVILMLTSGDRPGDVQRCKELGVSAYLRKPVKQSELLDAIVAALDATHAEEAPSEGAASATVPEVFRLPSLRILLAEDSLVNQKLALGLLTKAGHHVTVATNGFEAVDLALHQAFDLVLMDVQMPDQDGLQATRAIREFERGTNRHLPIIAMTAHAMTGDREKCLDAGMDGYVAKPVRSAQLFEAMASVLQAESPATAGTSNLVTNVSEANVVAEANQSASGDPHAAQYRVNWDEALRTVHADHELLSEIAAAFVEESARIMPELQQAIADQDCRTAERLTHTIKASFRTFGVQAAYELAYQCEQVSQKGELSQVAASLPDLQAAVTQLHTELGKFIATGRIPP